MTSKRISKELDDRLYLKLTECIAIAEKRFNQTFEIPMVEYNVEGMKGGSAKPNMWSLHFNPIIFNENVEHYLASTVPHELAHLIDNRVYSGKVKAWGGRRSIHGNTWKSIMRLFGAEPNRCHSYDVNNAQLRVKNKFHYECPNCHKEFVVGPVRHKKMQRGLKKFKGRDCCRNPGTIVFIKKLGQVTYDQAQEKIDK